MCTYFLLCTYKGLNIFIGMEIKLFYCYLCSLMCVLTAVNLFPDAYTGDKDSARLLARMYAKAHPTMHMGKPRCVQNEGSQFCL